MGSDDRAALVALCGLPGAGPARLRALLDRDEAPLALWEQVVTGRLPLDAALAATCTRASPAAVIGRWTAAARAVDVAAGWEQHRAAGVEVIAPGDAAWPAALLGDPEPPAVLFASGRVAVLREDVPAAAVVGTRQCSRYGWDTAHRFGADLAAAGVAVVSGLATGIDGAAHRGVLDSGGAPPIGVVATGLDVVYPPAHRPLWEEVTAAGVLLSESPLGTTPARWRFPARNRIIAALAKVVVVVESAARGGAMHTVDEAIRRDRPVLAVPGPVTSRTSTGTNRLLSEGAAPACDVDDVLVALGLDRCDRPLRPTMGATPHPRAPAGDAAAVLDAFGWQPATLDQLVLRTGLTIGAVARLAVELEADGWLSTDGGWYERRR